MPAHCKSTTSGPDPGARRYGLARTRSLNPTTPARLMRAAQLTPFFTDDDLITIYAAPRMEEGVGEKTRPNLVRRNATSTDCSRRRDAGLGRQVSGSRPQGSGVLSSDRRRLRLAIGRPCLPQPGSPCLGGGSIHGWFSNHHLVSQSRCVGPEWLYRSAIEITRLISSVLKPTARGFCRSGMTATS